MSTMIESLAQTRHAERYEHPQSSTDREPATSRLQGTRSRAGWLLIGLGLRLALPSSRDAARRITLQGR